MKLKFYHLEKGFMFLGNLSRKLEKYKLVGQKKKDKFWNYNMLAWGTQQLFHYSSGGYQNPARVPQQFWSFLMNRSKLSSHTLMHMVKRGLKIFFIVKIKHIMKIGGPSEILSQLVIPNYSILKYSIARVFFFKYPGYPGDSNSPKNTQLIVSFNPFKVDKRTNPHPPPKRKKIN